MRVTILFTDIRNFTTISERLEPYEVVEMLNHYLSEVCEKILDQGGTIDKFIGDAVMAIFGAPVPKEDQALRAVRASLDLVEVADSMRLWLKQRFPGRGLPEFRIGVGIHTGSAVVGSIGSKKRMEYTAIGDAVNIASRLESLSKKVGWTIVSSMDTLEAAGETVRAGAEEMVQVKGKNKSIRVCEILEIMSPEKEEQ